MSRDRVSGRVFHSLTRDVNARHAEHDHPAIILGNTKMEDFAGVPKPNDPAGWTKWNSSCHTCHGSTSGNASQQAFFPFHVWTGPITDPGINAYKSLDFVWSIAFHAR